MLDIQSHNFTAKTPNYSKNITGFVVNSSYKMGVRERLKKYLAFKGLSEGAFEQKAGLSKGYVSNIKGGITATTLNKIKRTFPELNTEWLLEDIGEMENKTQGSQGNLADDIDRSKNYKVTRKTPAPNAKPIDSIDYPQDPTSEAIQLGDGRWAKSVPLVREYAFGGYAAGWKDPEYIEELPKHVAIFDYKPHSEYFAFEVVGESMENFESREMAAQSYYEGTIVTARLLSQTHYEKNKLHLHKWKDFVIVTDDGILLKRIIKHDVEKGIITCHSLNPDKEEYPDFELDLRVVRQILNVLPKV